MASGQKNHCWQLAADYWQLRGAVAQLGEHLVCNQGVAGSIPVSSTRNRREGLVMPAQDYDSKTAASWAMIWLGIIVGAYFLVLVAPVMWFTLGKNDTWPEIVGGTALLLSMLPASILAIFRRTWAGVWLTIAGAYFAIAAPWATHAVDVTRGFHRDFSETIGMGFLGWIAVAFGLFFWITGAAGWPNLKGSTARRNSQVQPQ